MTNLFAAAKLALTGRRFARAAPVLGAATLTLIWFALLGQRPLFDPDEGRYAEIPREMLAGGDWVIPHLNGLAYLEKPPLQYWLTALAFRMFGQNEFSARLWTGIAGYCSLGLVFWLGYRLWDVRAGLRALLLTAASTLFNLLGHQLTLDMLLSTCLLGSLACFLLAEQQAAAGGSTRRARAWMLGCWASMALAVLAKGPIGVLIPAATLVSYALWQRDGGVLRRLQLRWGVPLFAVIAAPWFIMAARANSGFLEFFFVHEHLQRFLTPIEHRGEPWWFFAPVLAVGIMPWLPQALRAMVLPPRPGQNFHPARVLWAWSVFVLLFFSLSHAKLIPYILPAIPSLALLCAAPQTMDGERRVLGMSALLSLGSCMAVLAYAAGAWNGAQGPQLAAPLAPLLAVIATTLALAAAGCGVLASKNRVDAAYVVLCCGWFLATATLLVAATGVQKFFSSKDAATALQTRAAAGSSVFSVRTYEQSFTFYLRRTVMLVDYRDEFTLGLTQAPRLGLGSLTEFSQRWRSLRDGYAIMPPATHDLLLSEGLPMREVGRFPNDVLISRR